MRAPKTAITLRRTCAVLTQGALVAALTGLLLLTPASGSPQNGRAAVYWADVMRVAEILGGVHYLRDLCNGREGQVWREKMRELLDVTAPDADMRELLVSRFNAAYHKARAAHGRCTGETVTNLNRLTDEGANLSARLSALPRP